MDNPSKDINQFQKEIDQQRADTKKAQEASLNQPSSDSGRKHTSSVASRAKENNRLDEKPKSRTLDSIFVAVFFLFVGAAGVHFVGRMADSQRFALMTGMGGAGCGLIAGYVAGASDRYKK